MAMTAAAKRRRQKEREGTLRHCWSCGEPMGIIENKHYSRDDTCGKLECEREARDQYRAERDEAHERLYRDMGWDR